MSKQRYTPEQIIGKLREAEALAQGERAAQDRWQWSDRKNVQVT